MSSRLVIDNTSQLKEVNESERLRQPFAVRLMANIISYIFHPVFVPVYIVLFLLYIHSNLFAGLTAQTKKMIPLQAILMYSFFPLISVLLLRALKFVRSIFLKTQKDRIIPFVICNIWYFWIWYVWRNLPGYPRELVILSMGIFLASCIGLMANIYMRISLHAISMGVVCCFMFFLAFTEITSSGLYTSVAVLITGLVCSSRFIVSGHTRKEIYGGLLAGIIAQLASIWMSGVLY